MAVSPGLPYTARPGRFYYRVKHRLLPRPLYVSFDDERRGDDYVAQLEAMLAVGVVPKAVAAKARRGPIRTVACRALKDFKGFPWLRDGPPEDLRRVTSLLSRRSGTVFELAGCPDLHLHDLRHEATCRLYEKTALSDVQIARITGHKDLRMLRRYASLRGSDLAAALW